MIRIHSSYSHHYNNGIELYLKLFGYFFRKLLSLPANTCSRGRYSQHSHTSWDLKISPQPTSIFIYKSYIFCNTFIAFQQ